MTGPPRRDDTLRRTSRPSIDLPAGDVRSTSTLDAEDVADAAVTETSRPAAERPLSAVFDGRRTAAVNNRRRRPRSQERLDAERHLAVAPRRTGNSGRRNQFSRELFDETTRLFEELIPSAAAVVFIAADVRQPTASGGGDGVISRWNGEQRPRVMNGDGAGAMIVKQ